MGQEVQYFEQEIQEYLQTQKEVVCVNTGTSALHLSLEALDIGDNDEVLVPSLTYVASFQAISASGATPISCDVLEDTLFLDVTDSKKRLTSRTKAIMPVHYASDSQYMDTVYSFAQEYGLSVIEDAAHSFGSLRKGQKIGIEGDILCFSFDGIKNITSGEGGAILSSDESFLQRVKDGRLLGVEKDTQKRYSGQRSWNFDVKHNGFRYHMNNIMAAIGREQLKKIEAVREKRQDIVQHYMNQLKSIEQIKLLELDYQAIISHIFVIRAQDRNGLMQELLNNNIECGVHYKPNHLLSKYKTNYTLPITEKVYREILTLPCQLNLTLEEQDYIINIIKNYYE